MPSKCYKFYTGCIVATANPNSNSLGVLGNSNQIKENLIVLLSGQDANNVLNKNVNKHINVAQSGIFQWDSKI